MSSKSENSKRVAVIGCGGAGLPSLKWCLQVGFNAVCYEKSDNLGGLWRYRENDIPGISGVQKSTVNNSSKEMNAYSDFPMPEDFPNFLHNTQMVQYFEMYANKFNLHNHIKFNHETIKVEQNSD